MTKEELRAHCEKQVKMCEEWAKGNGREPSGKIYEEHKLTLDLINELQDKSYELWKESYEEEHLRNIRLEEKIKALEQQPIGEATIYLLAKENEKLKADNKILAENCLKDLINCHSSVIKEQQPCDDVMAIHTQGLDEGIRCAMCTNSMQNDRGCDGGCVVDEDMYKKIMDTIKNHIVPPVTPTHSEWHLVKDELPKEFSFVNCTCRSLIDDRPDWVVETCYIPQRPKSPYSDWGNIPMLNKGECEVIAWMYRDIPKPYEEKRGGEND